MVDKCADERAAFEAAQAAKTKHDADGETINKQFELTKRALAECEGSGVDDPTMLFNFWDTHVRIRLPRWSGSGNVIAETETHYVIETNGHVAPTVGQVVTVDFYFRGDITSVQGVTKKVWFESNKSKDVALVDVPKASVNFKPAVIPYYPNEDYEPKVGDLIFTGACMEGMSPRPRASNVLAVQNGVVYSDPVSIGGDSGSVNLQVIDGKLWSVGRLAWSIQYNGRWVCGSMSAKRVADIKAGRVAAVEALPEGWKYPGETPNESEGIKGV